MWKYWATVYNNQYCAGSNTGPAANRIERGSMMSKNSANKRRALVISVCILVPVGLATVGASMLPRVSTAVSTSEPDDTHTGSLVPVEPPGVLTATPQLTKPALVSMSDGKPPTEAELASFLTSNTGEFPRVDAVYVKHSTLGAIGAYTDGVAAGFLPDSPIWLVTGTGTFVPEFRHDSTTYTWGTIIVDATDGGIIGSFAAPGSPPKDVLP